MSLDPGPVRTIDVYELARTRGAVRGEVPLASLQRLAPTLADAQGTLRFDYEGELDDFGRPAARLRLAGTLKPKCDRCGGPVELALDSDARFYFVHTEEELNAVPIEEDEAAEPLIGSRSFDLVALIEDEAILGLPISPRHAGCAAAELPAAAAAADEKPHPFAALAQLKAGKR